MRRSLVQRSVHPAGHEDLDAVATAMGISVNAVCRVLSEAGLYAMPIELLLGATEEAEPTRPEPAVPDRAPAITFGPGGECRINGDWKTRRAEG